MSYYNDDGYRIEIGHHFDDDKEDFVGHFEIYFRNEDLAVSRYVNDGISKYIKTRDKAKEIAQKAIEHHPEWMENKGNEEVEN